LEVVEWARRGTELGAGEILLTSVDRDGTGKGFDVDLVCLVSRSVNVPLIASGGLGTLDHMIEVVREGGADAVAAGKALHYNNLTIQQLREAAFRQGLHVRRP
jgi:cyclase